MSPTIQLGLLGCGKMGQTLAQAVSMTGMGSIRAVFDIDPAKSLHLARTFGVEAAASEDDLLARPEIQAVMIALPPYLHFPATLKVVQAGKHIFLEKPMALETAACRQMNEAVRDAGLSLMVGHVLRYFEPFRSITRWAREGRLGKPLHGAIWRCEAGFIRLSPWKARRDLSGGYLFEIGAHELDWMRCLFGEAETIHAFTHKKQPSDHEIEDLVFVDIRFSSGVFGSYLGGAGFPCLDYGFCLRFEGATLYSRDAFNPQALRIDPVEGANPGILEINEGKEDPFMLEVRDWLDSLIQGVPVPISGEEAEKTVALIEAAYQSAVQARLPEVVGRFAGEKKSERREPIVNQNANANIVDSLVAGSKATIQGPLYNQSSVCEPILRSLPDWFGIEEAIDNYLREIDRLPTFLAWFEGRVGGFLTVKQHNPYSSEILVMAVASQYHRRGIGRALVTSAEEDLLRRGAEYMQVKTLGPSRPDEGYAKTRRFYEAMGYRPLEEFPTLWDAANPSLLMVKRLG